MQSNVIRWGHGSGGCSDCIRGVERRSVNDTDIKCDDIAEVIEGCSRKSKFHTSARIRVTCSGSNA